MSSGETPKPVQDRARTRPTRRRAGVCSGAVWVTRRSELPVLSALTAPKDRLGLLGAYATGPDAQIRRTRAPTSSTRDGGSSANVSIAQRMQKSYPASSTRTPPLAPRREPRPPLRATCSARKAGGSRVASETPKLDELRQRCPPAGRTCFRSATEPRSCPRQHPGSREARPRVAGDACATRQEVADFICNRLGRLPTRRRCSPSAPCELPRRRLGSLSTCCPQIAV